MENNLRSFLTKIVNSVSPKKQSEVKKNLEKQSSDLDIAAKLNILEGQLAINYSEGIKELNKGNQKANYINEDVYALQSIASEQQEFNYDFLTNDSKLNPIDRIEKFSKNSLFSTTSNSLSGQHFQSHRGLHRASCYVNPISSTHQGVSVGSVLTKLVNGFTYDNQGNNVLLEHAEKYLGSKTAAMDFVNQLKLAENSYDETRLSGRGYSYDNDDIRPDSEKSYNKKLYNYAIDMAEKNFIEYQKIHTQQRGNS